MAQPMTGRDSAPLARSNRGISIFAEEKQKMTARTKPAKNQKVEKPAEQPAAAATPVETVETATPAQTAKQEREALKAAGYKHCPTHAKYLDRLSDEAKVAVEGYADISIRPIAEYQKNTSTCRACDHIIQKDWRAAHKQPGTGAKNGEATLAKLVQQRDALTTRIEQLQTSLAQSKVEA